ncbi:Tektin-2 [Taenia solium]|eukprot:TsM_000871900 transcript=TsM_000871900 gene=TsM_000871900
MATFDKKRCKFQMPSWFLKNDSMTACATWHREASEITRHDALTTLYGCQLRTQWDNLKSTTELANRLDSLNAATQLLEQGETILERGISDLNEAKEAMEKQIQEMQIQEDCNIECLVLRDRRRDIDFAEDKADLELRKEQRLLLKSRKRLQEKIDEALNQLLLMQDAYNRISADIKDKKKTIEIDVHQTKLKLSDASLKVDPTRIPPNTKPLKEWEDFSRQNYNRSLKETGVSTTQRYQIFNLIEEVANGLIAQAEAVDSALRERAHEVQQALTELKWQKKKVEEEIEEVLKQLDWLEQELDSELQTTKIAHTRLENRTYRPGMDLCRDMPQCTLTNEARQLATSRETLLLKQSQCRHRLDGLQRQRQRLIEQIAMKENSLSLDKECLELRRMRLNGSGQLNDSGASKAEKMATNNTEYSSTCSADRVKHLGLECPELPSCNKSSTSEGKVRC